MIVARILFDEKLFTYTRRGHKQLRVEHELYLNVHNLLMRIRYSVIKLLNSTERKNIWIENNYTESILNAKYDFFLFILRQISCLNVKTQYLDTSKRQFYCYIILYSNNGKQRIRFFWAK